MLEFCRKISMIKDTVLTSQRIAKYNSDFIFISGVENITPSCLNIDQAYVSKYKCVINIYCGFKIYLSVEC